MKVPCVVEGYDSILKMRRPNGSSQSWYLKETGKLRFPGNLSPIHFLDYNNNFKLNFERRKYDELQVDNLEGKLNDYDAEYTRYATDKLANCIEYLDYRDTKNIKYFYPISMWCGDYWSVHRDIGFSCIDSRVKKDIREYRCKIIFEYTSEPHSWGDIDMFDSLEKWRIQEKFPPYSVVFLSGNLLAEDIVKNRGYKLIAKGFSTFESMLKVPNEFTTFNPIDSKNLFLNYNRMPRCHRFLMLYKLIESNLSERGIFSYSNKFPEDGFKIEDSTLYYRTTLDRYFSTEPLCKVNMDIVNFIKSKEHEISNQDLSINQALTPFIMEDYNRTFLSLVSETNTNNEVLFFSEKIWKPVLIKHPFILVGNPFSIRQLKEMGYKTFDKWWSEDYDVETDQAKRMNMIIGELNKLSTKSVEELFIIRDEMKEVLDHNFNNFIIRKEKYHGAPRHDRQPLGEYIEKIYENFCDEKKNII